VETGCCTQRREIRHELYFGGVYFATGHVAISHPLDPQNSAFIALNDAQAQLKAGQTGQAVAHKLIDESNDVLTVFLDEQVPYLSLNPFSVD